MKHELCFPEKVLEQHLVTLGKTGSGKSSALRHMVEHLLSKEKRVCVIDPKGDWWGLKSSADGKGAGFPVIMFGDFKNGEASDVPINERSGKHIAELVATGNRPCVIGFRGWMTSHMVQFWIDFASTLFNLNVGELYIVGDEFHNFAPKGKIMDPQAGKCLHWSNRLLSEGRGLGMVFLIASQRPQKVHNDTLTSCETLVAMRVVHKADRDAIKGWIEGCGDMEMGRRLLSDVAGMERGEAFVWSPEISFGPEKIKFPMFGTFDSFAPPQLQKKVINKSWADVDLEAVKEKLASVIEEQKRNDPNELKREIAELKRALAKPGATSVVLKPVEKVVERPVLSNAERNRLAKLVESYESLEARSKKFEQIADEIKALAVAGRAEVVFFKTLLNEKLQSAIPKCVAHINQAVARRSTTAPFIAPAMSQPENNGDIRLGRCERAIMTVLAQHPNGRDVSQIAILTGYSGSSGGFNNALGKLRSLEFITRGSPIQITQRGLAVLGKYEPLPKPGNELQVYWLSRLPRCERMILEKLCQIYPEAMTKEQLGEATGYSAESGGFNNALGKLRTLELVNRGQPMKANDNLF